MPTMQVFRDGYDGHRRPIRGCKACGRKLMFCRTPRGKWVPFEEMPDPIADDGRLETVSTEHVHIGRCPQRQPVPSDGGTPGEMPWN